MTTVSTTPGSVGPSDQNLAPGTEVGEYKVEALIGEGGFGTVYRAQHPLIGKVVAIKVLARKYSADPDVVSRFVAEARAVNQIRHRNIIDIFSFGTLPDDGRHYYVMEHLDGETLDRYLKRTGPLPLAEAVPILKAIARALDAAHQKGIAHRDLKPENIFLAQDPDGGVFPKLLDFGIAKLLGPEVTGEDVRHRTATGMPLGTPYYMSPEQCRGKDVDHRTDVYSLGIVAYRVLTGTYPFEGDDYVELLYKQVNADAPPPSARNPALPPSVDTAIAWMLRKDRAQRPATVLEAVLALDPASAPTPGSLQPRTERSSRPSVAAVTPGTDAFAATTAQTPPRATPTRRPAIWIGGALVLVCAAAVAVLVMTRHDEPAQLATNPAPPQPKAGNTVREINVSTPAPPPPPTSNPTADQQKPVVTITITDVPARATALVNGKTTELPGTVELDRGTSTIAIVLRAPGYKPRTVRVVPDRDQSIAGTLDAIVVSKPPSDTQPHDKGDTIHLDHGAFGTKRQH